jgi:hypothetical protein
MKFEKLSYQEAEKKYEKGFERTKEEILKKKSNEILNKLDKDY